MKTNRTFADKCLVGSLTLCLFLTSIFTTGCAVREVVQKAVSGLNLLKSGLAEATVLQPELQQINPELAAVVAKVDTLAAPNVETALSWANKYLASPKGEYYQELLNVVDSATATIDQQALAAAHVTNQASQSKILAGLVVSSILAHGIVGLLEEKASKAQIKAMPVIAARVDFNEIKKLVDRDYVRGELAKSMSDYEADAVMTAAGL